MVLLILITCVFCVFLADKESATSESKDSMTDLVRERDQALEDLNSVENAFSDLHRRFETLKSAIDAFKKVRS